jgi:RNA polymerase sigma-70 factor (ECF subfamily)
MSNKTGCSELDEAGLHDAMVAYQSGRAEAFERLYAGLAPVLRRYHQSMARDGARVEDLVQETFLRIHRSRHTYSPAQPLLPWVLAIARHVFLMDRRSKDRRGRREVQPQEGMREPPDPANAERPIEVEALEQALARIPAERRETLVLHHVHGLGFREIARRLGISEGAAKVRSSRGVAGLRGILRAARRRGDADER